MGFERYRELIEFWKNTEGLRFSEDDSYENLVIFLKRNPKLSFIALYENSIIGTIKSSHDGRRGYLHHLAVKEEFRREGIARELINKCLAELLNQGISAGKVRVFVLDSNRAGLEFWRHVDFTEQQYDYRTFQIKAK
jgi:putative acetyltransferase